MTKLQNQRSRSAHPPERRGEGLSQEATTSPRSRMRVDGGRAGRGLAPTYALLATMILIHGLNWPLMALGLRSTSPLWFSVLRFGGGAVVIVLASRVSGQLRLPPREDLAVVISVGVFGIALPAGSLYVALQFVPAGRSSVLVWTASLWAVPMAALFLKERMTRLRWASLAVGISGIVLIFEPWRFAWSDRNVLIGHGLLLVAAISNAATLVHLRGHRWRGSPFRALPSQLLIAATLLLVAAMAREGRPRVAWSWQFGLNVAFQILVTSGILIWAQQVILRRLRVTSTTLLMMGVPVVGLASSVVTLGESVTGFGVVGVAAIISGVAIAATADRRTIRSSVGEGHLPSLAE
jgi:drug/metabolite transporter (DMT)-like permease